MGKNITRLFKNVLATLCIALVFVAVCCGFSFIPRVQERTNKEEPLKSANILTLDNSFSANQYVISAGKIYKHNFAVLTSSNSELSFDDKNTLQIAFLKDNVTALSSFASNHEIASIVEATKTDDQIILTITDEFDEVVIETSLDAEYSLNELALNVNERLGFADGEFFVARKNSTNLTGFTNATNKQDAQVLNITKGSFTFKTKSGSTKEYDGKNNGRAFMLSSAGGIESSLTIEEGITIKNFSHPTCGGAIYASGDGNANLTLDGCIITNCSAPNGGAVYTNGDISILGTLSNNSATTGDGGAVYVVRDEANTAGGVVTVLGISKIEQNTAAGNGGGIAFYGSVNGLIIYGNITNNSATNGGGIYTERNLTMYGGSIAGNTASNNGGGIYSTRSITISRGTIGNATKETTATSSDKSNYAGNQGGGIYISGSTLTLGSSSVVAHNYSVKHGGGVFSSSTCTIKLSRGAKVENNAGSYGGGIYVAKTDSTVSIVSGVTFSGNFAHSGSGGGIYSYGLVTMTGGTFSNNAAKTYGGGLMLKSSSASHQISGGLVEYNSANTNDGGGIRCDGATTISGTVEIVGNTAKANAGGVSASSKNVIISGGVIKENSAGTSGGGVFATQNNPLTISGGEINGNSATNGGGIYVAGNTSSTANLIISSSDVKIINNAATYGNQIYISANTWIQLTAALYNSYDGSDASTINTYSVYKDDLTAFNQGDVASCYIVYSEDSAALSDAKDRIVVENYDFCHRNSITAKPGYLVCELKPVEIHFQAVPRTGGLELGDLLAADYWNYAGSTGYTSSNLGINGQYTYNGYTAIYSTFANQTVTLPEFVPIPKHRVLLFDGWVDYTSSQIATSKGEFNKDVDFRGYVERAADGVDAITITFYGCWLNKTNTYTIKYNNGSADETGTHSSSSNVNLIGEVPTRAGYIFAGWKVTMLLNRQNLATINMNEGYQQYNSSYPNAVYYELFRAKSGITYTAPLSSTNGNAAAVRWRSFDASTGIYVNNVSTSETFTGTGTNIALWYHWGNNNSTIEVSFKLGAGVSSITPSNYFLSSDVVIEALWTGNVVEVSMLEGDNGRLDRTTLYYRIGEWGFYSNSSLTGTPVTAIFTNPNTGYEFAGCYTRNFPMLNENGENEILSNFWFVDSGGNLNHQLCYVIPPFTKFTFSAVWIPNEYTVSAQVDQAYGNLEITSAYLGNSEITGTGSSYSIAVPYGAKINFSKTEIQYDTITISFTKQTINGDGSMSSTPVSVVIQAYCTEDDTGAYSRYFNKTWNGSILSSTITVTGDKSYTANFGQTANIFTIHAYHRIASAPSAYTTFYQTYGSALKVGGYYIIDSSTGNVDTAKVNLLTFKDYIPTNAGYTLLGYFAEDGNSNSARYISPAGYFETNLSVNTTANLKIYAVWEIAEYDVEYSCLYNSSHCDTVYLEVKHKDDPEDEEGDLYFGEGTIKQFTIDHIIIAHAIGVNAGTRLQKPTLDPTALPVIIVTKYGYLLKVGSTTVSSGYASTESDMEYSLAGTVVITSSGAQKVKLCSLFERSVSNDPTATITQGETLSTATDLNSRIKLYNGYTLVTTLYKHNTNNTIHTDVGCTSAAITNVSSLGAVISQNGYTFRGYYSTRNSSSGTQYIDAGGNILSALTSAGSHISIYAYQEPKTITVNLMDKNGNYTKYTIYFKFGTNLYYTASSCAESTLIADNIFTNLPVITGYTFKGYFTSPHGGGTQYIDQDGQIYNTLCQYWPGSATITLYERLSTNVYNAKIQELDGIANADALKTDIYWQYNCMPLFQTENLTGGFSDIGDPLVNDPVCF